MFETRTPSEARGHAGSNRVGTTLIAAAALLTAFAQTASAIDTTWTGGGDGVSWNDPLNWSNGVSVAGDRSFINGTGTSVTIGPAVMAATGRVLAADAASTDDITIVVDGGSLAVSGNVQAIELGTTGKGTLEIKNGGSVTVANRIRMGVDNGQANAQGIINVIDGTLAVTGDIVMGAGNATANTHELNIAAGNVSASRLFVGDGAGSTAQVWMTGGALTVDTLAIPTNFGEPNLTGHFQLDGGLVTVNLASTGGTGNSPQGFRLLNGPAINSSDPTAINAGTMDITGGTLVLFGDASSLVQDYINGGWLTGNGNSAWVVYDYDITNAGFTTVRAVPEPATLIGLLVGAALLWRRRAALRK